MCIRDRYMGKPLSSKDIQKINYFFDTLHFSTDLIEYLIEYCVEKGHKSMHYIESVALAWSDENIKSVTEAKTSSATYNKNCYTAVSYTHLDVYKRQFFLLFTTKDEGPAQTLVSIF